jgi:hypothetical protein
MDCAVPSCKCSCHRQYPQEINIKELMLQQIEKEYGGPSTENMSDSKKNAMLLFGDDDEENEGAFKQMYGSDGDALWDRRRRIHNGQEKPLAHEDYRNQFPKAEEIKKIVTSASLNDFDEDSKPNELWDRRRRIHNGQEKPLAHEDYRDKFPKAEEIKKIVTSASLNEFDCDGEEPFDVRMIRHKKGVKPKNQEEAPKSKVVPSQLDQSKNQEEAPKSKEEYFLGPKPVLLNPLHKLKVQERNQVIREVFTKALKNVKNLYSKLDENSEQFKEYVNKEADRQLELWMVANK